MTAAIQRGITRWVVDNLLWDTTGGAREGFRRGLWATRKVLVAVAGAAVLTWWEWVEHHPPDIAVVALIHLVFVSAAVALVVQAGRWLGRGGHKSRSREAKGPDSE